MMTIGDLQSPSRRDVKKAALWNTQTFNYYYTRMRNIAMSVYRWEGLPESCNARFLEKQLYYRGLAAFVPDPDLGWLSLPVNPSNTINIYDEALRYDAFSINYSKMYDREDIVLVRNNLTCVPTDFAVRQFAVRLSNIERSIDVNVSAQKTPVMILCDDKQRLTMKNLYMQYDGNAPVIFGDKSLNPEAIRVLKTEAPFIVDKLAMHRAAIWSEFLTFIGISNVGTEKKERLTESEASANSGFYSMMNEVGLLTRREAAEELSKRINSEVTVVNRDEELMLEREENLTEAENLVEREDGESDNE